MLLLTLRVGGEAYAVDAARIVEVVPRVELRRVPRAPEPLAGMFTYRGRVVPVIDLGLLIDGTPCRDRLSTRIILVRYPLGPDEEATLGLLAEQVSGVRHAEDGRVAFPATRLTEAPYLGAIVRGESSDEDDEEDEGGLIRLIEVTRVLSESLREALFGALLERT